MNNFITCSFNKRVITGIPCPVWVWLEICLKKVEVQQKFCSASYLLEITNPSGKKSLMVGMCETVETRLKEREDRLSFLFLPLHQDRFNRLKNL